jgi:hypothetical protein
MQAPKIDYVYGAVSLKVGGLAVPEVFRNVVDTSFVQTIPWFAPTQFIVALLLKILLAPPPTIALASKSITQFVAGGMSPETLMLMLGADPVIVPVSLAPPSL